MGFCYELSVGACSCPVRTTVCTALCHYMVHGIFITCFGFTNICYPPLNYIDYIFGGSGALLFVVSLTTAFLVDSKKLQFLRSFFAFLTVLVVIACIAASYYYVIMRWDDVMVTAFMYFVRTPAFKSLPDTLWTTLAIFACLFAPVLLIYLIYILSFMCNKWKSHLFVMPYQNNRDVSAFAPPMTLPADTYSNRVYKPYPVQKNGYPTN